MPNWIINRLKMNGLTSLPLFETDKHGTKRFDFNKIIKRPKSLDMEDGSTTDWAIAAALQKICKNQFNSPWGEPECTVLVKEDFFKEEDREKLEKLGYKYLLNILRYGFPTWYGWSCENWGTKWNASNTTIISDDEIEFETAWANPEPVIRKLGKMYPDKVIYHEWSDEDWGNNCGERTFQEGEWMECPDEDGSKEAEERAERLWGYNAKEEEENE